MFIVSILLEKRTRTVPQMQEILTKYGEGIYARMGFHNVPEEESDMIILIHTNDDVEELVKELNHLDHVKVNYMKIKTE